MKLLTVQMLTLVLIEGSQSPQCEVCEERLVGGSVRYTSDILDNICSDTEADNMDTCQSEEDVCKIQLLLRHFSGSTENYDGETTMMVFVKSLKQIKVQR